MCTSDAVGCKGLLLGTCHNTLGLYLEGPGAVELVALLGMATVIGGAGGLTMLRIMTQDTVLVADAGQADCLGWPRRPGRPSRLRLASALAMHPCANLAASAPCLSFSGGNKSRMMASSHRLLHTVLAAAWRAGGCMGQEPREQAAFTVSLVDDLLDQKNAL